MPPEQYQDLSHEQLLKALDDYLRKNRVGASEAHAG